jgi:hypothetical protein
LPPFLLGICELADDRILGSGEVVEQIIKKSEGNIRLQFAGVEKKDQINTIIQKCCENDGINSKELRAGSQRRQVGLVRKRLNKYW